MKKVMTWTGGGVALGMACGVAGLPHLSASIITLTAFCAVPAMLVVLLGGQSHIRLSNMHRTGRRG